MESPRLAIVGGGVAGIGVALAAAERGIKTALFEQGELGGGTSAHSLRIIHGGFRYLQTGAIARVFESYREQQRLLQETAGIVRDLTCVFRLPKAGIKSAPFAHIGCAFYRALLSLAGCTPRRAEVVSASHRDLEPLGGAAVFPYGALIWNDALVTDHAALMALYRKRLEQAGCAIHEHVRVKTVRRVGPKFNLIAERETTNDQMVFDKIVNATGASVEDLFPTGEFRRAGALPAGWCVAFNVLVRAQLHSAVAVAAESAEGRLFFYVPRASGTAIGTEYIPLNRNEKRTAPTEREIEDFLRRAQHALPSFKFSAQDVREVGGGILPMRVVRNSRPVLYGRHWMVNHGGFVDVVSTKYTIFRGQGEEVVRGLSR